MSAKDDARSQGDHRRAQEVHGQLWSADQQLEAARRSRSTYELQTLLDYLYDAEVDEEQLGILEWQLLPGLGFDARSPVLERRLARDPGFFVDILSLVYRPRGADVDDVEVPEHVATNAYRLLGEWEIVPGSTEGMGEVDAEELERWVESARELLSNADRVEIGDVEIGKVLAHARGDEDGTWPTKPVRDLLDKLASPEVEEGFEIQIRNNRGVTTRGAYEGGGQERELVKRYDDLASRIRDGWPRTAAVLAALARSYEREAQAHDEEVERLRQGMHR